MSRVVVTLRPPLRVTVKLKLSTPVSPAARFSVAVAALSTA
jgi:hypothetical protein